ncbi:CPBP family intramembrane metalloprotease [Robiginitalea sp. M366]|uniref:CPBP family intramembrane glutamic endopeptidase n=1 Tax=Robiginitalea aestuariiviva TaxID=3036903 RepID=UPI00240CF982|nr:CPBP family intramembrane glutamic endopeptidase [Robiginitalea aestuariiviva]MDG1573069.1 CPBP family intramembrane metalloprotease [Robiginitalea aestuariiviva]
MYIEQGYRGNLGIWKYLILPLGFIALMVLNYLATLASPVPVETMMADMIRQFGRNGTLVILLVPLAFGLFVVLGWTRLVHPQSIRSLTTSRRRVDWKRIFFAFGLWGLLTVLITGVDIWLSPDHYVWNFRWDAFWKLAVIALLLIPLQTSFEEYLFRGHMMQGLGIMAGNRWVPLVVTSVLFGLMHLGNPEVEKLGYWSMVYYIGTGFFLGIITLMDEGLELALGFHAANNLVTALLVTADWTAFQTDSLYRDVSSPALSWDAFIPIFVVFPLLLWIFGRKYGWKNWKSRLAGPVASAEAARAAFETQDA